MIYWYFVRNLFTEVGLTLMGEGETYTVDGKFLGPAQAAWRMARLERACRKFNK